MLRMRYGARDQRGVSVHRDSLIQRGLIWSPRRGEFDFTAPLFAEFLRENHPQTLVLMALTEVGARIAVVQARGRRLVAA